SLDIVDRFTDRLDFFRLIVRNGDFELLFQFHNELDDIERIGSHIFCERSGARYLLLVHSQVFADDLDDTFFNGRHDRILPTGRRPLRTWWRRASSNNAPAKRLSTTGPTGGARRLASGAGQG